MSSVCSAGHVNADGTAYCATCGLAITSTPATPPPPPSFPPAPAFGAPTSTGNYPYGVAPGGMGAPPRNGMGVAALVLGILSLFSYCFGPILGILAVIFGGLGISRANQGSATNKGMATAGLVMGIVGLVLWSIVLLAAMAGGQ